jgi:signal transduction histidine kinase
VEPHPLKDGQPTAENRHPPRERQKLNEPAPARILILDDEALHLKALCETLRAKNFLTSGFTSPREALAVLRSQSFDLLLTDLIMPEMDGIAFLRAAQEIEPNTVGIVMTGQGTIDSAVEAMKAGALDYILKPFRLSAILPVLARALAVRRLRMENEQLRDSLAMSELRRKNLELEEQSRRMQEASRMKNEFLAAMSHELRTPLNGIIGFSEFLLEGKPGRLNAKQKEYLGDVLRGGQHLLQLINNILDLSKAEAGKMQLHPEPLSLRRVIDEVCAVLRPMAAKKNIALACAVDRSLDEVTLDPQKLKQVLYNLLSNAVKFTDDGGHVGVLAKPAERGWFELQVRDTGIGIRREDLGKLFVSFQQIDSGAVRCREGTGLGLALTRKLVELHGGTLKVSSQFGRGSTFTAVLPASPGQPAS